MPGLAFHLMTLNAVKPPTLAAEPEAAALGAMGPDIFRFLPPSPALAQAVAPGGALTGPNLTLLQRAMADPTSVTPAELATIQKLIPLLVELWAKPLGTTYCVLLGKGGLDVETNWPLLSQLAVLLNDLAAIVQNQDKVALEGRIGAIQTLSQSLQGLGPIATKLQNLITTFGFVVSLGPWMQEPVISQVLPLLGTASVPDQTDQAGCRLFEFLRWHRSGDFAANLMSLASSPHETAFAEGWRCHLVTSVTVEPFINNIVGGPYRTHWWRNMLVRNFVDSWIFGFVGRSAQMQGDEPTPPYEDWSSLPESDLWKTFNVGDALTVPQATAAVPPAVSALIAGRTDALANSLPQELIDISELFKRAIQATYSPDDLPKVGASALPDVGDTGFAPDTFRSAFVGAFAVYWFLTASPNPFGNNTLGAPPPNCGTTPPSFLSSGSAPSLAQEGVDVPAVVCAVVFAILAVLALLVGDIPDALIDLAAAVSAPVVDWDTVGCDVFFARSALLAAENALRDQFVFSGLAFPAPILLGGPDVNGNTQPATDLSPDPNLGESPTAPVGNVAPTQGVPLTKTNSLRVEGFGFYPAGMDTNVQATADLAFGVFPFLSGFSAPGVPVVRNELPATKTLVPSHSYPSVVFKDTGIQNGGIMNAGSSYPSLNAFLGDAVANGVAAFGSSDPLPNYNLDGDRGYGWLGWHPAAGTNPADYSVQDEADG